MRKGREEKSKRDGTNRMKAMEGRIIKAGK